MRIMATARWKLLRLPDLLVSIDQSRSRFKLNHKKYPGISSHPNVVLGNVYTVTISHTPTCTCPVGIFKNKSKETLCKHALYILHNVLKVPEHLKQQNAFLTSELKEIFANAPPLPSTPSI